MSRATELAKAEADKAEQDEAEQEQPDGGETPAEPEQPDTPPDPTTVPPTSAPPSSVADVEKKQKALAREDERHAKRVSEIMGDEAIIADQCPLCATFAAGFVLAGQVVPQGSEQYAAVKERLGEVALPKLNKHPTEGRCSTCDGWGKLDNESRVPGQEATVCADCGGTGHRPTNVQPPSTVQPPAWQQPQPQQWQQPQPQQWQQNGPQQVPPAGFTVQGG